MKKKKLFLALALLALPTLVQAQFNYTNNGNGTCTITGYTGPGGAVTIPNSIPWTPPLRVVSIGEKAFYGNSSLTSIAIPASVTSIIAPDPFGACGNLTAITVDAANSSYSSVDGVLFDRNQSTLVQCPGGKTGNYVIPAGITYIQSSAFDGCFNLTGVTIPDSVTGIGYAAFYNCTSLTNVIIPAGVTSIAGYAFASCTSLASITILNSVTSIGNSAFSFCFSLTSVTIPNSVTNIQRDAFDNCTNLTAAYFLGNAPFDPRNAFVGDPVIVYYLPGATGWGPFFSGRPTELWNPQASALGVTGGHFGFNITGPSNTVIVVEACTNLANGAWVPLQSLNLTNGAFYFSDPTWTNYPARFYRIRSP